MTDEVQQLRLSRPDAAGPTPDLVRQARQELLTAIQGEGAPHRPARRWLAPVAVPALAAAIAAVVFGITLSGRSGDQAWGAELVRVAEAAPRLLVDEPGWQVTRADQFSVDYGEMTFADGELEIDLKWLPAGQYAQAVAKREVEFDELGTAPAAGAEARLFRYTGTNDFVAVWLRDDYTVEVRGIAPDAAAFRAVLASLREVDVDTWLSAMPESVVVPAWQAEVVAEMLTDIPLPPGFDAADIPSGQAVRDRYQLGALVTGAVACAWIDRWVAARRDGDREAAREAVDAMGTSRGWAVLLEMNNEGGYPDVLWEYADALATDAPVSGGRPLTVEESYEAALGCDQP
jgi:hypothetical protein